MADEALMTATGLNKRFGGEAGVVDALRDVTLQIGRGEFVSIVGPSGSGKTTLLHCLSGITSPDGGRVTFDGHDLRELSEDRRADLRRDQMGFVFQRLNLLPALTVEENVQLPLVLRSTPADIVAARTQAALRAVGMADRGPSLPRELSGGEAQRVAIARALANEPEVIWADEPTGALDSVAATEIADQLRAAADAGASVVLVTHDSSVASRADRVLELVDGRLTS